MKTRIHVWHDQEGKIIAVGKPAKHMVNRIQPQVVKSGHSVLSTEVEEDTMLRKLHQTHHVDVANARLKRNS